MQRKSAGFPSPAPPPVRRGVPAVAREKIEPAGIRSRVLQPASMFESDEVIRNFNDLALIGPGVNFKSSFNVEVPRKSGELVAVSGKVGPGAAYLVADEKKPTKSEERMVALYTAASGRSTASGKLRDNTEEAIRLWMGRKHRVSTSGLDTQAQHVVPFSELHSDQVVKLYTANSEHPFNSQLLPNKSRFEDEIDSVVSSWAPSSSGIITLPSSFDYSELSGSFHQGFHSAYSKGTWDMMVEVIDDLAAKNGGKWTSAMMEAAIFHAQKTARTYASKLYPLYRHFRKGSAPIFAFPHFSSSDVNALEDVAMADDSDQNELLGEFVKEKLLELGGAS
jgi:hypothetical protein